MDLGASLILAASGVVLAALLAAAAGERLGAPLLLVFLTVGVVAGPEGLGLVVVEDPDLAFALASAALAVILLDGGLRTQPATLQAGVRPGLSLATLGVLVTAGIVALAAHVAFGIGWAEALLIGAVVSSTDAAAVFSLLGGRGAKVKARVAATLETESGLNDPAAVFLTLTLAGVLASGEASTPLELAGSFVWQGVGGLAVGAAAGWLLTLAKPRLRLAAGLRPLLTLSGGVFAFALAQFIGASGFLAAYVCGLMEARGNRGVVEAEARALDGFAWLSQLLLFLTLGLMASPAHISSIAAPAIAVALTLIFVARPVATFLVLAPFKFPFNERLFASWVGLRGATPIFLGLMPLAVGTPNATLYFSVAFVIVGVSLVAQGWTTPLAARVLGVTEDEHGDPQKRAMLGPLRTLAVGAALAFSCAGAVYVARIAAPISLPAFTPQTVAELETDLNKAGETLAIRLPPDWETLDDAERRKRLFIDTVAPLVRQENARVLAERAEIEAFLRAERAGRGLSVQEQARRDVIAGRYGAAYADLQTLLRRVDTTPVSLAVAQAALTTGWGRSDSALQSNALYGRAPAGGEESRASFPSLSASIADYIQVLNAHPAFGEFRRARAFAREDGRRADGLELSPHVAPFTADGATFAQSVARIIDTENLGRLDRVPARGQP